MIIDFHTHCYPDKIAEKAVAGLSGTGGIRSYTNGTLAGLLDLERSQGVSAFIVNNIATDGRRMHNVNDFAISINSANVIAFGSVAPFEESSFEELERLRDNGIIGVKFHPYFQNFYVDDPRVIPLYEKIRELGMITLFHAGSDISFDDVERAEPKRLKEAALALGADKGSDVVFAHWGASMQSQKVLDELCGLPVYFDTAFGLGYITEAEAKAIINAHGADRILFGSDCPWSTPERELGFIRSLGLTDEEFAVITYKNAKALLGRHKVDNSQESLIK